MRWSACPSYSSAAARGCRQIAAAPAASKRRAVSAGSEVRGVSPRRILTVTGTSTARTIASTMPAAAPGSASSAAPAPVLQIFGTGHPMLMSIRSAPAASTARAASTIASRSAPKTWTPTGCSSGTIASMPSVLRLA